MTVVRCGDSPVPPSLMDLERIQCEAVPTKDDVRGIREHLPESNRLVVCADDAGFAALLSRFMRSEDLGVEFAYVTDSPSPATAAYGLPTGSAAAKLALTGAAREVPLIRDETASVIIGVATVTAPADDDPLLEGEAYADSERVFYGKVPGLDIRPSSELPGIEASDMRRHGLFRRRRWFPARAVQLGMESGIVTKDGVRGRRPVKRASFYRHLEPLLLVSE